MKLQDFVQDKPVLETERLILRPLRKEDVSDLKEWLGDSSIVAFRLSSAYQGNRLMTEVLARVVIFCFEETELQRLWADVHAQNIASYKTLEKAGFKREGLIREGKMVNTYCDYYLYGMTKADYIEITDKGLPPLRAL